MKKKIIKNILVCLFITLIITGCNEKKETTVTVNKFEEEYEKLNGTTNDSGKNYMEIDIPTDNLMTYATMEDLKNIFENKGTGVIYFGYPECPWCRNAVPNLIKAAKKTALDKIYYLNVHDIRDTYIYQDDKLVKTKEGTEDYYHILKWLDSILDEYVIKDGDKEHATGEKRLYVPTVVFVRDGTIVGYHDDTVPTQEDPYVPLTDEESQQLQDKYEELIHKVLNDLCDEAC